MSFSALPLKRLYKKADTSLAHNAFLLLVKTLRHLFIFFWNAMSLSALYPCDGSQNQPVRSHKVEKVFGFKPPSSGPCSVFCGVGFLGGVAKGPAPFFQMSASSSVWVFFICQSHSDAHWDWREEIGVGNTALLITFWMLCYDKATKVPTA